MPGLDTGEIVSVTFWGTLFAQRVMNVLHYRVTTPSTTDSYEVAAKKVGDAMHTGVVTPGLTMLAAMGSEYTMNEVRVQRVHPTRGRYVSSNVDLPGTHAGDCTSPNVSAVIIKKSASVSRHGLGTFHLPGIPETGYSAGFLTPAYQLLIDAISATLVNPTTVVGDALVVAPVIWTPADGEVYYPIIGTTVVSTLRIMRRRTVGLGI